MATNAAFSMKELPILDSGEVVRLSHLAKAVNIPIRLDEYIAAATEVRTQARVYYDELQTMKNEGLVIRVPEDKDKIVVKHSWHDRLATDVKLGRTCAVRGPAGNGKSTGVAHVLKALGYNIYHMDCTDSTTIEQLVGGLQPVVEGGGMKMIFKPGIVTKAFLDPKGAIQLDEFDAIDPRVAMSLQSALHRATGKKRWLASPEHEEGGVSAVGDCPIVVTMNTWGSGANREYVGRNVLDGASMDRFNTIIDADYEFEEEVLKVHGIDKKLAIKIVKDANALRKIINENAIRIILSTRRLLDIAESVTQLKVNMPTAWNRDFLSRVQPEIRKNLEERMKAQGIKLGVE